MKNYILLIIAAFLYTLGFPNILSIYIPFSPILATSLLIYCLFKEERTKQRLIFYFFYNLIINILSFYWITNTLQEFGKLPFFIAALMNGAFTFIFNPQFVVLILILHIIDCYIPRLKQYYFRSGLFTFLFAALMTTLEYFIPQQFPVMLGQPWIILSEYLGVARYLGLPIFTFMSYLLALEINKGYKFRNLSYMNLVSILIFILINPFLSLKETHENSLEFNVRLVQANISNFLKVDSETGGYASTQQVLSRYRDLSIAPFKENKNLDLIVWPETAYPYPVYTDKNELAQTLIPNIFSYIISKTNSNLLIGGYDHFKSNPDGSYFKTEYNAAMFFNRNFELNQVYHKQILIPFGETLPFGPLNKWISTRIPEMAFFAEGTDFPLFKTDAKVNFISSICYEVLRPEYFRNYLNSLAVRPQLMINLTNDSWYGNTVEPEQHLFLAKWRSIEFDLPILRSTNTGISTFIERNGTESQRLEYDVQGNLDLSLKLPDLSDRNDPTFFQQFGFFAIVPLWIIYFIFHLLLIKLKND